MLGLDGRSGLVVGRRSVGTGRARVMRKRDNGDRELTCIFKSGVEVSADRERSRGSRP